MPNPRSRRTARWPSYVVAGPFLFFGGQSGRHARTGAPLTRYGDMPDAGAASTKSPFDWVADMEAPVGAQAIAIYDRYRTQLAKEGGDFKHLLRYHIYQRDKHFFSVFDRVRRTYETAPPASTAVGMGRFDASGLSTLCIDAIALLPAAEKKLGARAVVAGAEKHTAAAHFSHVISAGPFLFIAGQIPIDASKPGSPLVRNYDDIPEEGRFLRVGRSHEDARNGPIASQTWFTYDLIRQHLEAAGSSLENVLNLIVYLQDIRDFPTFHRVHERFFRSRPPALTVIEAPEVGHKGTLIEIEPTAVRGAKAAARRIVEPRGWHAPAQMSAVVHADGLAFFSGIVGTDESGLPLEATKTVTSRIRKRKSAKSDVHTLQTAAIMAELKKRLDAARSSLRNIAHLTVYMDDVTRFPAVEPVLLKALGRQRPALTLLETPAPAPVRGARVSITAIGWLADETLTAIY